VNHTNNNYKKTKKQGLNENKRGKLIEADQVEFSKNFEEIKKTLVDEDFYQCQIYKNSNFFNVSM
jgi:hypothetical protein